VFVSVFICVCVVFVCFDSFLYSLQKNRMGGQLLLALHGMGRQRQSNC